VGISEQRISEEAFAERLSFCAASPDPLGKAGEEEMTVIVKTYELDIYQVLLIGVVILAVLILLLRVGRSRKR
jgi:hypothetical protein